MLQDLSSRDGLTGIPNRRRFDEALQTEWLRAARDGALLSLIMADIDHFKEYNDAHGHLPGDDCLRRVAAALARSAARAGDLVARYGGEEFACVLPGSGAEAAVAVAERMRAAVAAEQIPHGASTVADHVTVSLGATTTVPSRAADPTLLLRSADQALYRAKEGGRDRIVFAEPAGRAR
jgi:diguanylate cyclase (GGDEF)-like protein